MNAEKLEYFENMFVGWDKSLWKRQFLPARLDNGIIIKALQKCSLSLYFNETIEPCYAKI